MIALENEYYIKTDGLNNILQKRYITSKGESVKIFGYYTTLEGALEAYMDICIAQKLDSDTFTLKEAVEIMKSEHKRIEALLK